MRTNVCLGIGRFIVVVLLLNGLPGRPIAIAADTATVTINADKVLVIAEKKVFPIGFTMPPPPDGKAPRGKNGLEELHDAGANFLRTGVMGTAWNEAAFALEQKYQDAAARHGMHCLVNLRELGS